jgi:hypothetical protein
VRGAISNDRPYRDLTDSPRQFSEGENLGTDTHELAAVGEFRKSLVPARNASKKSRFPCRPFSLGQWNFFFRSI